MCKVQQYLVHWCVSLCCSGDNAFDLASSLVEYELVSEEDRERVIELINEKLVPDSLLSLNNNNSFAETWHDIWNVLCVCVIISTPLALYFLMLCSLLIMLSLYMSWTPIWSHLHTMIFCQNCSQKKFIKHLNNTIHVFQICITLEWL